MERVEPIQPIKRALPVRQALPDYFEFESQYIPRQRKKRIVKKTIKKDSKPGPDKQKLVILDGVGDSVDYKI